MKSSVRPASGAPRAIVSSTRVVVVPTASTRCAASMRSPRVGCDGVALAVDRVLLERRLVHGAERVEADVQRDALDVERCEQLRREVQAGGRRGGGAGVARVDGLVALGIGERRGDVRRQRRLAVRLAVEAEPPASLAEVLDQLDGAVARARA